MGPRPRGRGIVRGITATGGQFMLQWGRDRAVAELHRDSPGLPVWNEASMGPRPRGRGITSIGCDASSGIESLQWGRDRAVAELHNERAYYYRMSELQWGRDRAVAELCAMR